MCHCCLFILQCLEEGWGFRWDLNCLPRCPEDISTYGTFRPWLLEQINQVAAAVKYPTVPFPKWPGVQLLSDPLPPWALEVLTAGVEEDAAAGIGECKYGDTMAGVLGQGSESCDHTRLMHIIVNSSFDKELDLLLL